MQAARKNGTESGMVQASPPAEDRQLTRKVRFLRDPAHYPESTAQVDAKETHMSWVFLTEAFAYKLKKPVKYPYLDFSTPAKRQEDAEQEVILNRRLAGETYIGVVPLVADEQGELKLGATGEPVDFLVKMHRLPEDRMLDRLMEQDGVPMRALTRAAERLARFYRQSAPKDMDSERYAAKFEQELEVDHNGLAATDGIDRDLVEHNYGALRTALAVARAQFAARAGQGRIIDGHGDLRPEHICLTAEPVFFDCLEFNQTLRTVDPLDELAYLDIECERYGHPSVAHLFKTIYCRTTRDSCPSALYHLYQAKRAYLRARLCAGHLGEAAYNGSREWMEKTAWYLHKTRTALQSIRA